MQHAEQPALLCEKVEWLHAHEGAAKGPGIQATTREAVCNWRRTPSVTIASCPVQRKTRWQSVTLVPTQRQAGVCPVPTAARWNYTHSAPRPPAGRHKINPSPAPTAATPLY